MKLRRSLNGSHQRWTSRRFATTVPLRTIRLGAHHAFVPELTVVLLGKSRTLPADELEQQISHHTGRALRALDVSIAGVPTHLRDALQQELEAARKPEGALADSDGSRWIVTGSSYSHTDGGPSTHSFQLREAEPLEATAVDFGGLTLQPLLYSEEADSNGQITIKMRFDLNAADSERFEALLSTSRAEEPDPYFDVVRHGIDESPLRARFGRCYWQPLVEGRAHLIHLASERGDDPEPFHGWSQPELGTGLRLSTETSEMLDGLLDELSASGALADDAVARVRAKAEDALKRRWRDFDRVADINDWWR